MLIVGVHADYFSFEKHYRIYLTPAIKKELLRDMN